MKLKEFFPSLFHTVRLRSLTLKPPKKTAPVIVSLTSIPSRLGLVDITIRSLLAQELSPFKIILWLNEDWQLKIPNRLKNLQNEHFEIRYCPGTSSYRKLIPTLKAFPQHPIVTVDDDVIYPKNWLEGLYEAHKTAPDHVVCQYARTIARTKGVTAPYSKWPFLRKEQLESNNILPIGFGGVLYPNNSFGEDVFSETVYMELAPKADDLWFRAQTALNDKKILKLREFAQPIPIINSQTVSLKKTNVRGDSNRKQWDALCDHYPELASLGQHADI